MQHSWHHHLRKATRIMRGSGLPKLANLRHLGFRALGDIGTHWDGK